jgi:hypothetical protein
MVGSSALCRPSLIRLHSQTLGRGFPMLFPDLCKSHLSRWGRHKRSSTGNVSQTPFGLAGMVALLQVFGLPKATHFNGLLNCWDQGNMLG